MYFCICLCFILFYLSFLYSYIFFFSCYCFFLVNMQHKLVIFFLINVKSQKKTNKKCIKCLKLFDNRQNEVEYKECENTLHQNN